MGTKSRAGNSDKTQYKAYQIKGQWRKNKEAKLTKRALVNENDTHALDVFLKGGKVIGRHKPGSKGWFAPQEAKLNREIKSGDLDIARVARAKLAKLQEVYEDKRPTPVRNKTIMPILPLTVAQQFLAAGVINAKRYKTFEQKLGSIRKGRTVSKRR